MSDIDVKDESLRVGITSETGYVKIPFRVTQIYSDFSPDSWSIHPLLRSTVNNSKLNE